MRWRNQSRPRESGLMRSFVAVFLLVMSLPVHASEALWKRLQTEPNLVVLMRHAKTAGGNPLTWDPSGQCQGERMLSEEGKTHARKLGEEFRKRRITPVVISSPMCRTHDTANLAFGSAVTDPDLREIASAEASQKKAFRDKAKQLLLKHRGAKPVVFVSHRPNIDALALEVVATDELLVGKIGDDGEVEVVGRIKL